MKTRELKVHELMDGCLYLVGKQVARYRIINNGFETLDGKRLGYLTRTQRARALCCRVMTQKTPSGVEWHMEYVKAILITPEIMEKNGFEKYAMYHTLHEKQVRVEYYWYESRLEIQPYDGEPWIKLAPIHYVHELQNLMKICGLDELADKFVV